jgi:transposase InsO family protein
MQDNRLKAELIKQHQGFKRAYGAPRMHVQLKLAGFSCSRRRITRLMKELNLCSSTKDLYSRLPNRGKHYSTTRNHLNYVAKPSRKNQQWVGDFTHIRTQQGWLFHAVVMDLFTRKLIGWSFSRQRNALMTQEALKGALVNETPGNHCIFHSDQGIEYAANDFKALVENSGLIRSMSRKATPIDNAAMESYFHTFKAEAIHGKRFKNQEEAMAVSKKYITFYNQERLHSSLGYTTPEKYEKLGF